MAVLVAVAVAIIGVVVVERWQDGRSEKASTALSRIERMAATDLLPGEHPDVKDEIPRFKTAGERRDAVLRDLETFLKEHGGTRLRDEALVIKGAQLLAAGRNDDAIAAYQSALEAKLDARLRFLAHEGIGYANEAKGDLDKALAAFATLADDAPRLKGFYEDRALFHKARLTQRKGDKAAAVKLYRDVLVKVPDSSLQDEIADRLALLEAE